MLTTGAVVSGTVIGITGTAAAAVIIGGYFLGRHQGKNKALNPAPQAQAQNPAPAKT